METSLGPATGRAGPVAPQHGSKPTDRQVETFEMAHFRTLQGRRAKNVDLFIRGQEVKVRKHQRLQTTRAPAVTAAARWNSKHVWLYITKRKLPGDRLAASVASRLRLYAVLG